MVLLPWAAPVYDLLLSLVFINNLNIISDMESVICLGANNCFTDLNYADDTVLSASIVDAPEQMINKIDYMMKL